QILDVLTEDADVLGIALPDLKQKRMPDVVDVAVVGYGPIEIQQLGQGNGAFGEEAPVEPVFFDNQGLAGGPPVWSVGHEGVNNIEQQIPAALVGLKLSALQNRQ